MGGLQNLGNTCFLNSIMQMLFSIYDLNKQLTPLVATNADIFLLDEYRKLYEISRSNDVCPRGFIQALQIVTNDKKRASFFPDQQDASECLQFIIECFHNASGISLEETYSSNDLRQVCKPYSYIAELFYGVITSTLTYEGNIVSTVYQPFFILDLPIVAPTLEECIQHYTLPEPIDEPWLQESTGQQLKVVKQMQITTLPPYLWICLKRFHNNQTKDDRPVAIPNILFGIYELIGICNHFGNYHGGHYTASIKDNTWKHYNDLQVNDIGGMPSTHHTYLMVFRKN